MPLIKSKSDKAFGHNVAAEMHAGKPQKQSLAIAYSVKRRAKKMAQGGTVTANNDKRVTVDEQDMPRESYREHEQDRTSLEDSMSGIDAAKDEREMEVLRGKDAPAHKADMSMREDKMVSVNDMYDDRDMEVMRGKSEGHDHELTANEDMHTSIDDAKDEKDLHMIRARMAEGGMAKHSIAEAIRMRKAYAEGGEVDLSENADESPNMEDRYNYDALHKEIYDESDALSDLDYDTSKSIGHDLPDEDEHDRSTVSRLRNKMRMK